MRKVILAVALLCLPIIAAAQNYSLAPVIKLMLLNNDGSPCVGCKLYSYSAGTSTPLATYTDSSGLTQNANPIMLDSAGRANVWLSSNSYKFVLKDADGVTLWTVDNVTNYSLLSRNNTWTGNNTFTGTTTFSGTIGTKTLNGIRFADEYATAGAGTSGSPWTGWESAVTSAAAGTMIYFRDGYYTVGSTLAIPSDNVNMQCASLGARLSYSGASWAIDNDTHQGFQIHNCRIDIGTSSAGAIRIQHRTSASNANNWVDHVFIVSSAWTSGQVGVLLYTTGAGDSNYRNVIDAQTLNVDRGVRTLTSSGVANGSNANTISVTCNGHTVCADIPNGTDEDIYVHALGVHGFTTTALVLTDAATATLGTTVYTGTITGGSANGLVGSIFTVTGFTNAANNGTFTCTASTATTLTLANTSGALETHAATAQSGGFAVRFGGTDGGNAYGSSNNSAYVTATEQGNGGVTIGYLSSSQVNTMYGAPSDPVNIFDISGVTTNRSNIGGVLYNQIIGGNFIAFGGVASAASVGLLRNGTEMSAVLGDQSAYANFGAAKYQVSINNSLTDALTSQRLYLGNNSNIRQGSIWGGNTGGNFYTMSYMTNNTTPDGTTYTSFLSSYGSWVYECVTNTTDSNSNCGWYYRNAAAADGKGTKVAGLSNLGIGSFALGIAPITPGVGTVGSASAPFQSVVIGTAINKYNSISSLATTSQSNPLPDASGPIAIKSAASTNHAVCWKTADTLGYCSTQPDASGICTCN